ncbi:Succinyl-diaminopimelate desuccinylase [Phycisphaerae bacterium RAS1]|nr:Succinyl-diaminopimelate desuccinylase [Phycisphaerae bacterium RAS1]
MIDHAAVLQDAKRREDAMVTLLRELVAIPGESGGEGPVIQRIRRELESCGWFDRVWTDPMGNLLAQLGAGPRLIAIDAHVDTVGIGDRAQWKHDPYQGKLEGGVVYGRGAGDQRGAVPAMIHAAGIIRGRKLLPEDVTLLLTFTVSEEDCDGLCWQYIIREDGIRPECVIVTDSTNCQILRGQRGRMEIGVTVHGRSCHGSMPDKGDNAVYKIARVVQGIEQLNRRGLRKDRFLGNGTITVSYIDCKTPSLCAVPDQAYIHLDRRLTTGETKASALREVRGVLKRAKVSGDVRVLKYSKPTHTGLMYETESVFPTWCEPESAPQVQAAVATYRALWKKKPKVGRWTFSTNGVAIAGMHKIPAVGFGPAAESVAHTVNDSVPCEHLVRCAAFYAAFPAEYVRVARK